MKLKELVSDIVPEDLISLVPTGFDTVGDIMIFNDFPDEILPYEEKIAQRMIEHHNNIHVVAKKTGKYSGTYRVPQIKVIAGDDRKETVHRENGVRLKLDVEQAYFSTRTANERLRIVNLVEQGERILVMFSGIAPLPCVIGKNTDALEIVGVEINPVGHEYGLENIKLNKLKNVTLYNGDVREIVPTLDGDFDRILMPLPMNAEEFLDVALGKIKSGGIIHLYAFICEEGIAGFTAKVMKICSDSSRGCEVMDVVKCGQFSPSDFRMSFDLKIE